MVKLTLSAAMRARDVSRPHDEHLEDAAAEDIAIVRGEDQPVIADDRKTQRRDRQRRR